MEPVPTQERLGSDEASRQYTDDPVQEVVTACYARLPTRAARAIPTLRFFSMTWTPDETHPQTWWKIVHDGDLRLPEEISNDVGDRISCFVESDTVGFEDVCRIHGEWSTLLETYATIVHALCYGLRRLVHAVELFAA